MTYSYSSVKFSEFLTVSKSPVKKKTVSRNKKRKPTYSLLPSLSTDSHAAIIAYNVTLNGCKLAD